MEKISKRNKIQEQLYRIIFESDTKSGKTFDIVLLNLILLSIASVMLESIDTIKNQTGMLSKLVIKGLPVFQ